MLLSTKWNNANNWQWAENSALMQNHPDSNENAQCLECKLSSWAIVTERVPFFQVRWPRFEPIRPSQYPETPGRDRSHWVMEAPLRNVGLCCDLVIRLVWPFSGSKMLLEEQSPYYLILRKARFMLLPLRRVCPSACFLPDSKYLIDILSLNSHEKIHWWVSQVYYCLGEKLK